jgi:hypothetical protein
MWSNLLLDYKPFFLSDLINRKERKDLCIGRKGTPKAPLPRGVKEDINQNTIMFSLVLA